MGGRPVLGLAELRAVEALGAGRTPSSMERAGLAVARAAEGLAADTGQPILVVAGPGNNGGDAWVAAAHLREAFSRVVVFDVTGGAPKADEARAAQRRLLERGGEVVREWPRGLHPGLVVDGLLGIGLTREIDESMIQVISRVNDAGVPVLAVDVPSGLDAQTGQVRGSAVRATRTLTFIARKPGLFTGDGLDHCGAVEVDDLGLGGEVERNAKGRLLDPSVIRGWLSPRRRNSHKGDFGTLGIVGGNRGMVGAALLAARAGMYLGAGKVYVGLLSSEAFPMDFMHPELMMRSVDDAITADVIVAGPGAGRSASATSISQFERSVLPALLAQKKALVLDADALNAIAYSEALRAPLAAGRAAPTILTPHPAEAARLLGLETAAVQADRLAAALELAKRFNACVVLKGAGSICAAPDGAWSINSTGNPGLATGGTGDVLAGIIGALLSQGLEAWKALQYAVCLHGAAADSLVAKGNGPVGLTASGLVRESRKLLNGWTYRRD